MRIRPRHRHPPRLQRLPQRIEHRTLKLRQFVEKQHAQMRKAHLPRPHLQPAADQRRHRRAMMRCAIGPPPDQPPILQQPRHRCHHRHFQRLRRRQVRQYPRQTGRHQRFARTRRPRHNQIMPARRRNLQRALGDFLPLHLPQIGTVHTRLHYARLRRRQRRDALEMVEQRKQSRRADHLDRSRPRRFRPLRRGADQSQPLFGCVQRRQQHPRRSGNTPVQPQLAHHHIGRQRLGIDHPHRAQQPQRDRQVVMRSLLGQVGRRQVHRDPLRRQRQPDRGQRRAHPLPAFGHCLVRQPDDRERRHPRRKLHLHLDRPRL